MQGRTVCARHIHTLYGVVTPSLSFLVCNMKKSIIVKTLLFITTVFFTISTFPAFLFCMYERFGIEFVGRIFDKFDFSSSYEFKSAELLYNRWYVFGILLFCLVIAAVDMFILIRRIKSIKYTVITVIIDIFFISFTVLVVSNTFYAAWIYQY